MFAEKHIELAELATLGLIQYLMSDDADVVATRKQTEISKEVEKDPRKIASFDEPGIDDVAVRKLEAALSHKVDLHYPYILKITKKGVYLLDETQPLPAEIVEAENETEVPPAEPEEGSTPAPVDSSTEMNSADTEDYKGEENGMVPDEPKDPESESKHENEDGNDTIEGTDPEDPALTPEVADGATKSPTGKIPELVSGLLGFMMEDEDTIQQIPVPTKEEGASEDPPVEDLDDKDPHNPDDVDIVIDISDFNRTEERQTELALWRNTLLYQLQPVELYVRNYNLQRVAGQEGFIANAVTGIANVIGHVVNLFNAGVLNGWRNFKRGELTAYVDSNLATMARIYRADFYLIEDVEIDTPQGMKGTYHQALDALTMYLTKLNMLQLSNKMLKTMEAIESDMHKANPSFTSKVKDANREFADPNVKKLFDDTSTFFTSEKFDRQRFQDVFTGMGDYEAVIKMSIKSDDQLRQVSSVHSRLMDIQKVTGRIVDEADKLNKTQIEDLAKVARTMAETFDNYATGCADLIRVQHNLTENTKVIRKKLGM